MSTSKQIKRTAPLLAMLLQSGPAFAAGAGTLAGGIADISGHDPWTWIIGGFGAAIVYVKKPAVTRSDAIINSMISVFIAGLISPTISVWFFNKMDLGTVNPYPLAFILSSAWPWLMPYVAKKLQSSESYKHLESKFTGKEGKHK